MMRSINIKRERKKHYVLMMMSRQKKTTTKNICIIIYLLKSVCIVWLLVKLLLLALLSWPLAVNSYLKMDFVYMQSTSKSELFPRTVGPSSTLLDYALILYVTTAVRAVTSDLFLPCLQATCVECTFIGKTYYLADINVFSSKAQVQILLNCRDIYSGHSPPPWGGGEIFVQIEKQGRI